MRVNSINDLPKHIQEQIKDNQRTGKNKVALNDQTIFINELPPGLNGSDGLMQLHWSDYRDMKRKWVLLMQAEKPEKHLGMVDITFTRKSVRKMDFDNLAASFKPVGDALEDLGIIEDDSPDTINEFRVRWEKADSYRSQGVRIEISNVE